MGPNWHHTEERDYHTDGSKVDSWKEERPENGLGESHALHFERLGANGEDSDGTLSPLYESAIDPN